MEPKFKRQHKKLAPLPTIINKEKEYEVEEVRKHKKHGRETQYLVHWKRYGDEHCYNLEKCRQTFRFRVRTYS